MRWKVKIRKFHRWLSIIIGIQILFWTVSGAYFSLVPLKTVRGEDRALELQALTLQDITEVISPTKIVSQYGDQDLSEIRLLPQDQGPVYALFFNAKHPRLLVDAVTGIKQTIKSQSEIEAIARADYGDKITFQVPQLLESPPPEYRGPLPVYQVKIEDSRATRLYLSPVTGEVLSRRNRYWRIFDFLWMLHIMDFQERENFNNLFLRVLSLSSIGVVISGYLLWGTSRKWKKRKKSLKAT